MIYYCNGFPHTRDIKKYYKYKYPIYLPQLKQQMLKYIFLFIRFKSFFNKKIVYFYFDNIF